jgi:hypothetical protein
MEVLCRRRVCEGSLAGVLSCVGCLLVGVSGSYMVPLSFLAILRSGEIDSDNDMLLFDAPRVAPGVPKYLPPLLCDTAVLPEVLEPASLGVVSPCDK